jgi:hypothetical protein
MLGVEPRASQAGLAPHMALHPQPKYTGYFTVEKGLREQWSRPEAAGIRQREAFSEDTALVASHFPTTTLYPTYIEFSFLIMYLFIYFGGMGV